MEYKYYKDITLNNLIIKVYYRKLKSLKRSIKYSYKKESNSLYFSLPYFASLNEINRIINNEPSRILSLINRSNKISKDYINYYLGEKMDVYDNLIYIDNKYLNINEFYKYKEKEIFNILYSLFKEEELKYSSIKHNFKVKFNIESYYGINYPKKNTIILNAMLIHFDKEIIKSVIDHELSHDLYHGHGKDFYTYLLKICPNYYELDKKLKRGIVK